MDFSYVVARQQAQNAILLVARFLAFASQMIRASLRSPSSTFQVTISSKPIMQKLAASVVDRVCFANE